MQGVEEHGVDRAVEVEVAEREGGAVAELGLEDDGAAAGRTPAVGGGGDDRQRGQLLGVADERDEVVAAVGVEVGDRQPVGVAGEQ